MSQASMRLPFALTLILPLLRKHRGPRHRLQLSQGRGAVRGVIVHCTRKVLDTPACSSHWELSEATAGARPTEGAAWQRRSRSGQETAQAAVGWTRAVKQCQTGLEPPPRRA